MDVRKLTDRPNAQVQGTAADGLKLALAFLWERRYECPRAVPILVCHDEVVVECEALRVADVMAWLAKSMIDGMYTVVNGTDERHVPLELEPMVASDSRE